MALLAAPDPEQPVEARSPARLAACSLPEGALDELTPLRHYIRLDWLSPSRETHSRRRGEGRALFVMGDARSRDRHRGARPVEPRAA
jgi:hypothetical protein